MAVPSAAVAADAGMLTGSQIALRNRIDRGSLIARGVPEDYADAVLDDEYMERLIKATNKLEKKRRLARDRYIQLTRYILVALFLQAALMLFIALHKTVLAPEFNFTMEVVLEDVDMVVMLDASNHLGETRAAQQDAASKFSQAMAQAMEDLRYTSRLEATRMMKKAREEKTQGRWFELNSGHLMHNERDPSEPLDADVRIMGGRLRLATGLFNAISTQMLHPLTLNVAAQGPALEGTSREDYAAHARWYSAMQACRDHYNKTRDMEKTYSAFRDFPRRAQRCYRPPKLPGQECSHAKDSQEACADMAFCSWKPNEDGRSSCVEKEPLCRKQFCIIIGDSDATCGKQAAEKKGWQAKRSKLCSRPMYKDLCPSDEDLERMGGPVEWSHEMDDCRKEATEMLEHVRNHHRFYYLTPQEQMEELNDDNDIQLIMLFTTPSESERQIRLRSPHFRNFVTDTTGCQFLTRAKTVENPRRRFFTTLTEYYLHNESCTRFIMEMTPQEMLEKSMGLRSLLASDIKGGSSPNPDKDWRYIVFLLGPINLIFYLASSWIIKTVSHTRASFRRALGVKKKMIKVTKQLVEKVPLEVLPEFTELEMAEIQKLKLPIEFGRKLNLRARLKGGFLRTVGADGGIDADGRQFESPADWYFEPAGPPTAAGAEAGNLTPGQRFRIRNALGQYLCVNDQGVRFLDERQAADRFFEDARAAREITFSAEPLDDTTSAAVHLHDTICIRCMCTGGFLRVTRAGQCDGMGRGRSAETQFQVDLGGMPIGNGACITLRHDLSGQFLIGSPKGGVRLGGGSSSSRGGAYRSEDWRLWLVEKVEKRCRRDTEAPDRGSSSFASLPQGGRNLVKEGDVVTLRSMNGHLLEVDESGAVLCGPPPPVEAEPTRRATEFVVHRVGVTRVNKYTSKVRCGGRICLRPITDDPDGPPRMYIRWTNEDGGKLVADASVWSEYVSFTVDQVPLQDVVRPISYALDQGDADVFYGEVWDKRTSKRIDALSAAWTTEETLRELRGPVSVVTETGGVSVPKNCDAWVAVVSDGIDLFKACAKAKSLGATGLIVKCEEACSLDRLVLGALPGSEVPSLPVVFINERGSDWIQDTGNVLKGCQLRRRYLTDVMRALGLHRHATTPEARVEATVSVFVSVGEALKQRLKEDAEYVERAREAAVAAKAAKAAKAAQEAAATRKSGVFKWQVSANTNYYWASGAGEMKNSYPMAGALAKPSAREGDFSKSHWDSEAAGFETRTRRISVTRLSAEDVKNLQLSDDLEEVCCVDDVEEQELESLSKESDFKLEYIFEEVEVGIDEKPEELDNTETTELEQEYMGFRGKVIKTVGVPRSKFWMVAILLVVSSAATIWKLYTVMTTTNTIAPHITENAAYEIDLPMTKNSLSVQRPRRPLSVSVSSLRGGDSDAPLDGRFAY